MLSGLYKICLTVHRVSYLHQPGSTITFAVIEHRTDLHLSNEESVGSCWSVSSNRTRHNKRIVCYRTHTPAVPHLCLCFARDRWWCSCRWRWWWRRDSQSQEACVQTETHAHTKEKVQGDKLKQTQETLTGTCRAETQTHTDAETHTHTHRV